MPFGINSTSTLAALPTLAMLPPSSDSQKLQDDLGETFSFAPDHLILQLGESQSFYAWVCPTNPILYQATIKDITDHYEFPAPRILQPNPPSSSPQLFLSVLTNTANKASSE